MSDIVLNGAWSKEVVRLVSFQPEAAVPEKEPSEVLVVFVVCVPCSCVSTPPILPLQRGGKRWSFRLPIPLLCKEGEGGRAYLPCMSGSPVRQPLLTIAATTRIVKAVMTCNVHGHAPVIQPGRLPIFRVQGFPHQIEAFFVQAEHLFHFDQGLLGYAVAIALLQDQIDEQGREQGGAGSGKDLDGEVYGTRRGKCEIVMRSSTRNALPKAVRRIICSRRRNTSSLYHGYRTRKTSSCSSVNLTGGVLMAGSSVGDGPASSLPSEPSSGESLRVCRIGGRLRAAARVPCRRARRPPIDGSGERDQFICSPWTIRTGVLMLRAAS